MAAAVAAGGLVGREWHQLREQQAELRALLAQRAAEPTPEPVNHAPPLYEASARAMLLERSLPWPQALTMIEATALVGVTPISFDAVASDRSMRLEVTFGDYAKLLEYVDALNAGEPDVQWTIEQTRSEGGSGTAIAILAARLRAN